MFTGTGGATRSYGTLFGGMPYLSLGAGEPLVFLPGLGPNNEPPVGLERRFQAQQVEPFAERRRVWWINRRPGLAPDVTMADLARDLADALRLKFSRPVDVLGVSTGGSLALQLAADHPDVVKSSRRPTGSGREARRCSVSSPGRCRLAGPGGRAPKRLPCSGQAPGRSGCSGRWAG